MCTLSTTAPSPHLERESVAGCALEAHGVFGEHLPVCAVLGEERARIGGAETGAEQRARQVEWRCEKSERGTVLYLCFSGCGFSFLVSLLAASHQVRLGELSGSEGVEVVVDDEDGRIRAELVRDDLRRKGHMRR